MAITGDDQFEWRGFKIGDGTSYPVVKVRGLGGGAKPRRNPYDRVSNHGVILPRADLLGARELQFQIEVEGSSRSDLRSKLDALDAATIPDEDGDDTLQFQILGVTRRVYARPSPAEWMWESSGDVGLFVAGVDVEFFCQDPRVYTDSGTVTVLA